MKKANFKSSNPEVEVKEYIKKMTAHHETKIKPEIEERAELKGHLILIKEILRDNQNEKGEAKVELTAGKKATLKDGIMILPIEASGVPNTIRLSHFEDDLNNLIRSTDEGQLNEIITSLALLEPITLTQIADLQLEEDAAIKEAVSEKLEEEK